MKEQFKGNKFVIVHDEWHSLLTKVEERLRYKGHNIQRVFWRDILIKFKDDGRVVECDSLSFADAIFMDRLGENERSYASQIRLMNYLNMEYRNMINPPNSYWHGRDKSLGMFILRQSGIPTINTMIAYTLEQLEEYCKQQDEYFVVKTTLGFAANEIQVFRPKDISFKMFQTLLDRDGHLLIQKYINNPDRYIWRVDIVDDKVIVCNQRFAYNNDEFAICNGTHGGNVVFVDPVNGHNEAMELALKVSKAFDLKVVGVDIINDDGELKVLELNPDPDITPDHDEFPFAIADYMIKKAQSL